MNKWRNATRIDLLILVVSLISIIIGSIASIPSWLIAIAVIIFIGSFGMLGVCVAIDERIDKQLERYLLIDELDTIRDLK